MYFVYIIKSYSGKIYTGHTNNIHRRLSEHNDGRCKTTKSDTNWNLVYFETLPTRSEAMKREKWLKTGYGRTYLKEKNIV